METLSAPPANGVVSTQGISAPAAKTTYTSSGGARFRAADTWRHMSAALLATAPIVPIVATLVAVVVYLDEPQWAQVAMWPRHPLVASAIDLALTWVVLTIPYLLLGLDRPEHVNGTSYELLRMRSQTLGALTCPTVTPEQGTAQSDARAEFASQVSSVRDGLKTTGPAWITGHAYLDLWRRVHRAEGAWYIIAPLVTVVAEAEDARASLKGSKIDAASELDAELKAAIAVLKDGKDANQELMARATVRRVWTTIHRYRDDRWDNLLKSRNRLLILQLLCASLVYALVWVVFEMPVDRTIMLAATGTYILGAVIGVFGRLYNQSRVASSVDDYGLSLARHLAAPQLSGIAAIAGLITYTALTSTGTINVVTAFDVVANAGNLVTAAVFALTPGLLLERLTARGDAIKDELNSTKAGEVTTRAF